MKFIYKIIYKYLTLEIPGNCLSLGLYGSPLLDLQSPNINIIEITLRKCSRYVLGVPTKTRSYLLPNLMKSQDILCLIHNRIISFYITALAHSSKYISDV